MKINGIPYIQFVRVLNIVGIYFFLNYEGSLISLRPHPETMDAGPISGHKYMLQNLILLSPENSNVCLHFCACDTL